MSALGHRALSLLAEVNRAHSSADLDRSAQDVWVLHGAGEISDDEATELAAAVAARRPSQRSAAAAVAKMSTKVAARVSRFTPRQSPRSPNREASRHRRRTLGGSSALPDTLRCHYTEGQRAVLCIVSGEVKRSGVCDLPIDKIGALAGVCRTTVQTTLHEARRLGHITITERPVRGSKNLSNLVRIASREWLAWLKRGPSAHRAIGSKSPNLVSATKSQRKKEQGLSGLQSRLEASRPTAGPPETFAECRRA